MKATILLAILLLSSTAFGQATVTPEKSSPKRKAILNALRVPVERDLKQKIVFVTDHFKILGNWAFVSGRPTTKSGGKPNLKGTAWEGSEDVYDDNFFGLLKEEGRKWKVVAYAIGCTDVCYTNWWSKYKAPKAIFPYTE